MIGPLIRRVMERAGDRDLKDAAHRVRVMRIGDSLMLYRESRLALHFDIKDRVVVWFDVRSVAEARALNEVLESALHARYDQKFVRSGPRYMLYYKNYPADGAMGLVSAATIPWRKSWQSTSTN